MDEFQIPDIDHLEMSLKEKIHELKWKTDALDKMQVELNQNRKIVYDVRMLLDCERRRVRELKLQLKSSQEISMVLETNKIKCEQEKIQLQVNCNTAVKERDLLLNQTRNAKVENIMLKSKMQQLEEDIAKKEYFSNIYGTTLEQLKEEVTKLKQSLQSNILKLEGEQENLRQSIEVTTKLNHRLVVMGMCAHIEQRKQNETIKELQTRLSQASVKEMEKVQNTKSSINLSTIQAVLNEANRLESEDLELDTQVEAIIEDLQNADEE